MDCIWLLFRDWTQQETLLLLEALEMFKDDWNKVKQWFILIQPINGKGKGCAQDPMDPQHYGFLDPLKYADPWIR